MSNNILARKEAFEERRKNSNTGGLTTVYYLNGYMQNLDRSPVYREANALYQLYANIDLPLYPEEGIVGNLQIMEPVCFHYGGSTLVFEDRVKSYISEQKLQGEALVDFMSKIEAVRIREYRGANTTVFTPGEIASIETHAATSTWFGGHIVLDFTSILKNGLGYYQQEIDFYRKNNPDKNEFYDAMETILKAIQLYIYRYSLKASEVSALEGYDKDQFQQISHDLDTITNGKPQNFRQALQLLWIIHLLNGADSFGRFDYYLFEFYKNDIDNGILTKEEAKNIIVDLFIKIEEVGQIQNMTIGGVDADGVAFYNDLTEICVQTTELLGYKGPNLCLRVSKEMPEQFWEAAMKCIGTGIGLPALYNDEVYIDSLVSNGIEKSIANNYCLAGCSQIMIPGMSNFYNDVGILNAAKVMELAFYNGYDLRTEKQVGPKTGEVASFITFGQLYEAVCKQLDYFCDLETKINDKDAQFRASREGYAMRTLFIQDCIKTGKPIFEGGARYNNIELEVLGITNVADSLYAVKKIIFDEKKVSFSVLIEALKNNFAGSEELRKMLVNVEKFGNDCQGVDKMRSDISRRIFSKFNNTPTVLGGVSVPGEVIFTAHDYAGHVTGATPDGRYSGYVLADSAGASQGKDLCGPTALLNSVLKIPTKNFLLTSIVINLKFLNSVFNSSREKIKILFQTFFENGGMQLQVNVVDARILELARRHPDEYRSLVVRVGGYSEYFVNLPESLQLEIISRTTQAV